MSHLQTAPTPQAEPQHFCTGLRYLLRVPARPAPDASIVLAVHGISRNAQEHFDAFAPLTEAAGWYLVAPLFDADEFPDYQRLGRPGRGGRADLALLALMSHLAERGDVGDRDIHLFGHSGGAQFAHRFVMAHPDLVARYALSAPGWYTFPDPSLDFPHGLAHIPAEFGPMRPQAFLRVPGCVFVGDRDCRRGPSVRRTPQVDDHQGLNRLERAQRWTAAMNAQAKALGLADPIRLQTLSDAGHSFTGLVRRAGLHQHAWRFLSTAKGVAA